MNQNKKKQCEGWRRYGGALTFGTPQWEQCKSEATVILTVIQDNKTEDMPACVECWKEAIEKNIEILKVLPL